jgi:hypothetical protein
VSGALEQRVDEVVRRRGNRTWAAIQIALDIDTCSSLLQDKPVMAGRLDGEVLRRALRGAPLPAWDTYITVTSEMLDAVSEAGALVRAGGQR